ncbi:rhodanese-like domain-containing protein [Aureliella helgolandensis]|uniref:Molybdopterin biosynthesis protein MoeB n=1 Tax=Aureliella helgolandensis TaxID=2527968 RepID=A0A518G7F5_9BACT|nr:rhodanese-like domain-containing protein [Aureliella helgolandensis]QDV24517.1 molybdopterin biosynthesis protein MoeB [Aureliella helgolandensis]
MKAFYTFIAALSLICVSSTPANAQFGSLFGSGPKVETIDTRSLSELLSQHQKLIKEAEQTGKDVPDAKFVVVDVRLEQEINVSIIPGAITKTQYEQDSERYRGWLVIPYCTVGVRSGAYAKELASKNITVKNYKGSILKWVEAGLPLVTLEGKPTRRVHTYSDRYRIPANYEQVTR